MTRYWKAAVSARRLAPRLISTYEDSEAISIKTNRLKASPVTTMPISPVRQSRKQV